MRPFTYSRPNSATDAVRAHAAAGAGARYIAGGTTLYDLMKLDVERPVHLIDVTAVPDLDRIDTTGDRLRLGALAPMSAVASDPVVRRDYPVLAESLAKAASQQLRNMATVGGNLLQRTRCLYFRHGTGNPSAVGSYPCNKREPGSGCAAIGGIDRGQAVLGQSEACTAVSPGDWLGPSGARTIPIGELYRLPGETPHLEFTILPSEMITGITIPKTPAGRRSTYHKIRDRESYAFALASAAVALDMDGDRVARAHLALGGVGTKPWRAAGAERSLVGQALTPALALAAGRAALVGARPGRLNGFKIELGARTVADALLIAAQRNV